MKVKKRASSTQEAGGYQGDWGCREVWSQAKRCGLPHGCGGHSSPRGDTAMLKENVRDGKRRRRVPANARMEQVPTWGTPGGCPPPLLWSPRLCNFWEQGTGEKRTQILNREEFPHQQREGHRLNVSSHRGLSSDRITRWSPGAPLR